ncbi:MAG TPA: hypothetical protein VKA18_03230, partial [Alphaproteobacteria bacterium]|nr:hypothetical protein [Alphaproteobacteria bacterium]
TSSFDSGLGIDIEDIEILRSPESEAGLAGVRLMTVDGLAITTDAYGRFSVPCAALPEREGSNFILKLDERTLPTGYRVTTENPRVLRVTPGTVTKFNFGAALADVIDVDLMAAAFVDQSDEPTVALNTGLLALMDQLGDEPAVLRLSYFTSGEDTALARRRMDIVEDMIRQFWRGSGRTRLMIERTIRTVQ